MHYDYLISKAGWNSEVHNITLFLPLLISIDFLSNSFCHVMRTFLFYLITIEIALNIDFLP